MGARPRRIKVKIADDGSVAALFVPLDDAVEMIKSEDLTNDPG